MDDLTIDQIKQLLVFYKQKSADLEFELLKMQAKNIKPQTDGNIKEDGTN